MENKYQRMSYQELIQEKQNLEANIVGQGFEMINEAFGNSIQRGESTNFTTIRASICESYLKKLKIIDAILSA